MSSQLSEEDKSGEMVERRVGRVVRKNEVSNLRSNPVRWSSVNSTQVQEVFEEDAHFVVFDIFRSDNFESLCCVTDVGIR